MWWIQTLKGLFRLKQPSPKIVAISHQRVIFNARFDASTHTATHTRPPTHLWKLCLHNYMMKLENLLFCSAVFKGDKNAESDALASAFQQDDTQATSKLNHWHFSLITNDTKIPPRVKTVAPSLQPTNRSKSWELGVWSCKNLKFVPSLCWHMQRKTAAAVEWVARNSDFHWPIRTSHANDWTNHVTENTNLHALLPLDKTTQVALSKLSTIF